MSEWREVKLGDVCEIVGGGTPSTKIEEYWNGEINWISIEDIKTSNKYIYQTKKKITKLGLKNSSTKLLNKNSLIISARGTVGEIALLSKDMAFNQSCYGLKPRNEKINYEYLFYYLKAHIQLLKKSTHGSVFDTITTNTLKNFTLFIPPLPIQKKIADILSLIDEKIETLQNINETLEEMAKAIFKSWFVDFDIVKAKEEGKSDSEIAKDFGISKEIVKIFPSEFVESEIGKIPNGWEVSYLGEKNFSEIIKSGIEKFGGEKIYLATADVDNTHIVNKETKITYNNRPSRANMQPIHKSIWFAKMKDSKKLLMFDDYCNINSYILSTGFAGIKTTNLSHNFLWTFIMSDDFEKQKDNLANGAVQIAINNQNIKKIHFIKPTKDILEIFNKITFPIFQNIYFNTQQIQTLQELRDTLLPKLINGEIKVDELDIKGIENELN